MEQRLASASPFRTMFPEEILDYIFSLCPDVHCLEASSKAHPLLSRIAERHLYADITLHNFENYDSDCRLPLSNLLSEQPRIANYVLSLFINASSNDDELFPFLEAIPSILALLPKLRMMAHRSPIGLGDGVYPSLPESFRLSLENSFGLLSMKQVKNVGVKIPLSLLHRCENTIESLEFDHCVVSEPQAEVESSSSDCPPLENLRITEIGYELLKPLVHWVANGCGQLRQFRFSLWHPAGGFVLIKPILVSCSNTLTILDVDVGSLCTFDSSLFSLS
jgi:hypothetical protein